MSQAKFPFTFKQSAIFNAIKEKCEFGGFKLQ